VRSIDDLLTRAGIDPASGIQVVAVNRLAGAPVDPGLPLVLLQSATPDLADPALPGRHARRGPAAVLTALYPPGHLLRNLVGGPDLTVDAIDDGRLAGADWLLEALPLVDNLASPHGMAAISARLRAPDDGCPWDLRQDHRSLRRYLLEEAYETVDAIERGSPSDLAEELGDLFLQVILHAQMAAEAGEFDLTDVYRGLGAKIVRRHPHVFGDLAVSGVDEVLANWETLKAAERTDAGLPSGAFAEVARALPALAGSREIQERAAALGWDWSAVDGVWDKVAEELREFREADVPEARLHELGDVLFALVNLGRWLGLDPEEALREANHRWVARYRVVERLAADRGVDLGSLDEASRDGLWEEAKRI
jgi:MazG family protein